MADELDYQVSRCEPVEAGGGGYGCPFHQSDACTHLGAPDELAQGISEVLDREVGPGAFGVIPSRCPLRAHPVHVRLHSRLVMQRPKDAEPEQAIARALESAVHTMTGLDSLDEPPARSMSELYDDELVMSVDDDAGE